MAQPPPTHPRALRADYSHSLLCLPLSGKHLRHRRSGCQDEHTIFACGNLVAAEKVERLPIDEYIWVLGNFSRAMDHSAGFFDRFLAFVRRMTAAHYSYS